MQLWYRFSNAIFVQRLYTQQDFEMMFGSEVMRAGRIKIRAKFLHDKRNAIGE